MDASWREIERELEEWARGEGMSLDRAPSGDIMAEPIEPVHGECIDLNLTSLARRLADTLTLRLVEPALSRAPGCRAPKAEGNHLGEDHDPRRLP